MPNELLPDPSAEGGRTATGHSDGEAVNFPREATAQRGRHGTTWTKGNERGKLSCGEEARSAAATETPALTQSTPGGGASFNPGVTNTGSPHATRTSYRPLAPANAPAGPQSASSGAASVYAGASRPGSWGKRPHEPSDYTCT